MKKFTRKQLISFWIGLGLLISGTLFLRNANSELVDLNITGGISANDNPVTLNNGILIKGTSSEFRNAAYVITGTTVAAGTEYFRATPSSFTFNQNVIIDNDITLTAGGSLTSTANGDITLTPNGTGDVNWTGQKSTMTTAGALTTSGLLTVPNITLANQGIISGLEWAVIPSSSMTNSTDITVLYSTTIPANTLGSSGCVNIRGIVSLPGGSANLKYLFAYLNTTRLGADSYSTSLGVGVDHLICNDNATNSQISQGAMTATASTAANPETGSVNTTADVTLEIRADLQVATDTITWNRGFIQIFK